MPNAKLGAKVDRYSFFVRPLPPLLHTGLARRTNIATSLIDRALGADPALSDGWQPDEGDPFTRGSEIQNRGMRRISVFCGSSSALLAFAGLDSTVVFSAGRAGVPSALT